MKAAERPTLRQWLTLAVAVLVLNVTITVHNVWPTLWVSVPLEMSIELAVLLAALVVYSAWFGSPQRRAWVTITAIWLLLVIGRYADVTAPALYGRPVNFYWDAPHLPKVAAMIAEVAPWWLVASFVLGISMLLVALAAVLWWALARIAAALRVPPMRRALGTIAGFAVALFTVSTALDWPARHWYSLTVSATYLRQAKFMLDAYAAETTRELPNLPLPQTDLGRLHGADVLLLFLESYGAVTYDQPAIAKVVAPAREEFAAAALAAGRHVLSAFVESPTFGGASWLAHSSLMSGFEVRDSSSYNLLLTQQRDTLPKLFESKGYRAVAWMPGLRNPWPEGSFYSFDQIYGEHDIDYRGPDFGWWRIPDQYALAKLDSVERREPSRAPLFVFLPTINTHVPFLPVPPYQPDWHRVLSAAPFDSAEVAASLGRTPDWTSLRPAYADTFAYTFTYLAGYMREGSSADAVFVMLGDHQPPASVAGPSARWDVPVHVLTSRDDIAARLRLAGFIDGVELSPGQSHLGRMPELTAVLLQAFDSAP